jgi:hypothetical protein
MRKTVVSWLSRRRKRKHEQAVLKQCGCVCFCECGATLNDQQCKALGESVYRYTCSRCGRQTCFDFGFPAPVKVRP